MADAFGDLRFDNVIEYVKDALAHNTPADEVLDGPVVDSTGTRRHQMTMVAVLAAGFAMKLAQGAAFRARTDVPPVARKKKVVKKVARKGDRLKTTKPVNTRSAQTY